METEGTPSSAWDQHLASEFAAKPPRAAAGVMRQHDPGRGDQIGPLDWRKILAFEPCAASDRRGWADLEAARFRAASASEFNVPALTHHRLVLIARPPEELHVRYEGVKRHIPPPAGSILVIPAGSPARWRWSGPMETLIDFLEPRLVARVAAEAFDLDPARTMVPPLDSLDLPQLRATMLAVDAELTADGPGRNLAAESLANILAVHLIRHVLAPPQPGRGRDGALPRGRLRAVVEYIEDHLGGASTLEQLAAVARLSVYHFARQFKKATGLPPHQYVILRRVERARQLLQAGTDLSLAEVALHSGFSDQSVFCLHFKRLVGVTPRQFRMSARTA
jgi:AraC family transcriptional regulator